MLIPRSSCSSVGKYLLTNNAVREIASNEVNDRVGYQWLKWWVMKTVVTDTLIACGSGEEIGSYKRTTICSKAFLLIRTRGDICLSCWSLSQRCSQDTVWFNSAKLDTSFLMDKKGISWQVQSNSLSVQQLAFKQHLIHAIDWSSIFSSPIIDSSAQVRCLNLDKPFSFGKS